MDSHLLSTIDGWLVALLSLQPDNSLHPIGSHSLSTIEEYPDGHRQTASCSGAGQTSVP